MTEDYDHDDECSQQSPSGSTCLPRSAVDIGGGTWITKVQNGDGEWVGIHEWHHDAAGDSWEWCGGWVPFNLPGSEATARGARCDVASFDPLTLSPSLLCTTCQHHGFIRDGRWVSA